jgi:hypothetical protein
MLGTRAEVGYGRCSGVTVSTELQVLVVCKQNNNKKFEKHLSTPQIILFISSLLLAILFLARLRIFPGTRS